MPFRNWAWNNSQLRKLSRLPTCLQWEMTNQMTFHNFQELVTFNVSRARGTWGTSVKLTPPTVGSTGLKWPIAKNGGTKLLQTRSLHFISWISSTIKIFACFIQMINNLKRLVQIHTNSFHPKGLCETRLTLHPEWKSSSTTSHSKALHWAHDKSHHSAIKIMALAVSTRQFNEFRFWPQRMWEISLLVLPLIWDHKCSHCQSKRLGVRNCQHWTAWKSQILPSFAHCVWQCHSLPTPGLPHKKLCQALWLELNIADRIYM